MSNLIFFLLLIIFLIPSPSTSTSCASNTGFRTSLKHIDSSTTFTKQELISRAVQRSNERAQTLFSSSKVTTNSSNPITKAPIRVRSSQGEYLMDLAIGTPPRPFSAIIDTGSDLIWTQCSPCILCVDQPTPFFDPTTSITYLRQTCTNYFCNSLDSPLCYQNICVYIYTYGDQSSTTGILSNETFTFGTTKTNVTVPKIAFGCGSLNEGYLYNSSGMVGLGRGPLSLVNQLPTRKFAYCLTYFYLTATSPLLFGSMANLNSSSITGPVQSTPFIINSALPSLYYISLIGITVGKIRLSLPAFAFALNSSDGTGGTIIDSGSSITFLQTDAYNLLQQAFQTQVNLTMVTNDNFGLDICFPWPASPPMQIPSLTFHFDGANMTLAQLNYMLYDGNTGLYCVAIAPSTDGTIIGNYQQQNMYVIYDLENDRLSFAPARCDLM